MPYVPCPTLSCRLEIEIDVIRRLLNDHEFTTYNDNTCRYVIENNAEYIVCPLCNHGMHVEENVRTPILRCIHCHHDSCRQCRVAWHNDLTCQQYQASTNVSEQDRLNNNYIQSHTKICPRCSTPIEKNGGCDHITCRCGHEFCYVCLGNWRPQPQHAPHCINRTAFFNFGNF